jgi:hypothetical protein
VIPGLILTSFAIDLVIGGIYLLNLLLGNPIEILARFIDLDRERSLPTWYASIQWFGAAVFTWLFARATIKRREIRSLLLWLLPATFLAFSLDEIAQVHEAFGVILDDLLLGGRETSSLATTGIWFVVVGIPFVIATVVVFVALLPYLRRSPRATLKLAIGMTLFLSAAIGIEALSNLVASDAFVGGLQVLIEEGLELLAATTVLWGSYELMRDAGGGAFDWSQPDPTSEGRSDR